MQLFTILNGMKMFRVLWRLIYFSGGDFRFLLSIFLLVCYFWLLQVLMYQLCLELLLNFIKFLATNKINPPPKQSSRQRLPSSPLSPTERQTVYINFNLNASNMRRSYFLVSRVSTPHSRLILLRMFQIVNMKNSYAHCLVRVGRWVCLHS